ncbi:hypothetical protein [Rhodopirellula bahusiensis]|uniref:hypothetical protein n=1 Tax=Rhodopirellula bahusiensis TaxID=2014065 RepID=UPI0032630D31
MSSQTTKASQGDTYRCKECGMELQITKGCDCDECKTELNCCGQPLDRVNPQVQNA